MRDECTKKTKLSWTKTLVKKWLNMKNKADDFHADAVLKQDKSNNRDFEGNHDSYSTDVENYRIFAATWNVAGKSPPYDLNLVDWLHTSPPADIYVLGFQEIVPLNAGNVLGTEDNGPAKKWLALIRKTLNSIPGTCVQDAGFQTPPSPVPDHHHILELNDDFEEGSLRADSSFVYQGRRSRSKPLSHSMRMTQRDMSVLLQPRLDRGHSVCERRDRTNGYGFDPYNVSSDDDDDENDESTCSTSCSPVSYLDRDREQGQSRYCLVASKQMVGVFLTVWIKRDLRDNVHNLKVSCVGRGLMGYLGNKGSISISMSLHKTSFCFICCHLTSGQKEGDELRRNADVMEILRKTRFPRVDSIGHDNSPQTILDHDRIIWLGDLNYRISLSYRAAKSLVEMCNWRALLQKDQLRIEQMRGRVFVGWCEGSIYFPPTYKYSNNSDRYAGDDIMHPNEKRRTPAWCDRILWFGGGLHQISYIRGESRFSDHRPVYSIFMAEVEPTSHNRIKKSSNCSCSCIARIEVEELLPYSYPYN